MNTSVNCNCGTKCAVNFTCALVKNLYLSCLDCRQAASSLIQQQSSQGKHLGRKEKPGHKRVLLGASSLADCRQAASSLVQQQSSQGKLLGRKEKPGHKRVLLGASSLADCRQPASSFIQQRCQGKHLGRKEKPGHKRVLLGASSLPRCDAAVLGKQFLCLERMCSLCSQGFMVSPLLHPWVLEIGSGVDRANCLVDGSVRTLENNFKTAGRSLNDVLKYTVDYFTRSSDDS